MPTPAETFGNLFLPNPGQNGTVWSYQAGAGQGLEIHLMKVSAFRNNTDAIMGAPSRQRHLRG
jgi:hypothetical protein